MRKELDCDKSMKKMRLLVRQWKRMTVGILRELHLVKEYLTSQKNQCKDPAAPNYLGSSSWKGYCHEIGLPPQTADAWLRRCDFLGLPAAKGRRRRGA